MHIRRDQRHTPRPSNVFVYIHHSHRLLILLIFIHLLGITSTSSAPSLIRGANPMLWNSQQFADRRGRLDEGVGVGANPPTRWLQWRWCFWNNKTARCIGSRRVSAGASGLDLRSYTPLSWSRGFCRVTVQIFFFHSRNEPPYFVAVDNNGRICCLE